MVVLISFQEYESRGTYRKNKAGWTNGQNKFFHIYLNLIHGSIENSLAMKLELEHILISGQVMTNKVHHSDTPVI